MKFVKSRNCAVLTNQYIKELLRRSDAHVLCQWRHNVMKNRVPQLHICHSNTAWGGPHLEFQRGGATAFTRHCLIAYVDRQHEGHQYSTCPATARPIGQAGRCPTILWALDFDIIHSYSSFSSSHLCQVIIAKNCLSLIIPSLHQYQKQGILIWSCRQFQLRLGM